MITKVPHDRMREDMDSEGEAPASPIDVSKLAELIKARDEEALRKQTRQFDP